jgi:thioredoxin 1
MSEKKESFNEIINGNTPVLVDFFATWCGPCKMQTPILTEVSEELGNTARILKIDVDRNQSLAQKFGVRGVPTLIIFKNGEVKWRTSGVKMKDELVTLLKQYS